MRTPDAPDLTALRAERDALAQEVVALRAETARLEREMELITALYQQRLADLRRRLYGPSSEKADAKQLELAYESVRDDENRAEAAPPAPKPASEPRRGGGRRPAPRALPVERIVLDVPETERIGLVKIREEVTEEIDYQPSRFIRRQYVRPVYADPTKTSAPVMAALPARPSAALTASPKSERIASSKSLFLAMFAS